MNIHKRDVLSKVTHKSIIESLFLSKRLIFLILWFRILHATFSPLSLVIAEF